MNEKDFGSKKRKGLFPDALYYLGHATTLMGKGSAKCAPTLTAGETFSRSCTASPRGSAHPNGHQPCPNLQPKLHHVPTGKCSPKCAPTLTAGQTFSRSCTASQQENIQSNKQQTFPRNKPPAGIAPRPHGKSFSQRCSKPYRGNNLQPGLHHVPTGKPSAKGAPNLTAGITFSTTSPTGIQAYKSRYMLI